MNLEFLLIQLIDGSQRISFVGSIHSMSKSGYRRTDIKKIRAWLVAEKGFDSEISNIAGLI